MREGDNMTGSLSSTQPLWLPRTVIRKDRKKTTAIGVDLLLALLACVALVIWQTADSLKCPASSTKLTEVSAVHVWEKLGIIGGVWQLVVVGFGLFFVFVMKKSVAKPVDVVTRHLSGSSPRKWHTATPPDAGLLCHSSEQGAEETGAEKTEDGASTLEPTKLVIAGDEWEVLAEELQAGHVYFSKERDIRLKVQRRSIREFETGPGPIKLHHSSQLLKTNDRDYITGTIVHCPENMSFEEPLLLDFVLDDPALITGRSHLEQQRVLQNYQILRKNNDFSEWEPMEEENVHLVYDGDAFYLRARVHHFTLFSCCRNCDMTSPITYKRHRDEMAVYVENRTDKVLLLVTLPLKYSDVIDEERSIEFCVPLLSGGSGFGWCFARKKRTEYVSYPSGEAPSSQIVKPAARKQRIGLRDKKTAERLLICTIEDRPSFYRRKTPSTFQIVYFYDNLIVSGRNLLIIHQSRLDMDYQNWCLIRKGKTVLAHAAMALAGLSGKKDSKIRQWIRRFMNR